MAIIEQTRLYEALVRWNPDGTFAAHQATITELVDDSTSPPTVLSAKVNLPTSLAGADVEAVVGTAIPALQAQYDAATAQVASLTADLATANADKAAALTAQAQAEADRDARAAERDALQAQLDAILNPPIPHVISQRFKIALDDLYPGLLDTVEAFVATQPRATQLRWSYPEFYRDDAMLNALAGTIIASVPALAGTTADALLDAVFARALTIQ